MMKGRTSFFTRSLALVMALLMTISCMNLGAVLQVHAVENAVTYGELMAKQYKLYGAESDLLKSGYLAGSEKVVEYDSLPDGLVIVNKDTTTITAASKDGWVPTTGTITYGTNKKTIDLSSGSYNYGADNLGNAFSVEVAYKYETTEVSVALQSALLTAMADLKQGIANTDAVAAQAGNLYILEQAMPELVTLANDGFDTGNQYLGKVSLSDAGKAGIAAMDSQMTANGGKLNLSNMVDEYEAEGGSKTAYLKASGKAMLDEVNALIGNLGAVSEALSTMSDSVELLVNMGFIDAATGEQIKTLSGVVSNLKDALDAVAQDPWTVANNPALLNKADVVLDKLVAELGEVTAVTPVASLLVDEATQTFNMSMFNVTIEVVLNATNNNVVEEYGKKEATITLMDGALKAEILAAVDENGIENIALGEWADIYVDGKFDRVATDLPAKLTADLTYTITYSPKNYTVTIADEKPVEYPYGYQLALPVHSDSTQAYDYEVNGVAYAQGEIYVVVEDAVITRTAGKAYTTADLYAIIADNYGNPAADAILQSGALNGNEAISVRKPDHADAESLVKLEGDTLTAVDTYAADYAGLSWVPYSYGENGTENLFNGATEAPWTGSSVKVKYILTLTNYSTDEVVAIQDAIVGLKAEAAAQLATLDRLAAKYDQMGLLDRTKLGALNGVIDVTDLNADPAKNEALKAEFKTMVSGIINNNLDGSQLRIYTMLGEYLDENDGGLTYYYDNSAKVINEINTLSGYLTGLLDNDDKVAALEILVGAAGYPEYKDRIAELETTMAEVKAALTAPNALIDLESDNLYKLVDALESEDKVEFTGSGSPYLISENLTATDDSTVMVQLHVAAGAKSETFTTTSQPRGYVLTQADVDELIASASHFATQQLGTNKISFYVASGLSDLNALVGQELQQKTTNVYLTYSPIDYTVTIEGVGNQIVTIEKAQITLPGHPTKGWIYTYDVIGAAIEVGNENKTYVLSVADFENIAAGHTTITRTETNKAVGDLEDKVEDMKVISLDFDDAGNITGVKATVDATEDSLMQFATELTELGYSYIELNDEVLLETTDKTLVSLQTLMNAILKDNSFGSKTLINLGKNNGGKVFTAKMDLGNGADDIWFEGVDFTFNLKSVPAKMATVANGLEQVKPYMTFNSQDGVMNINLTLPEKVYEVYLTALLATGEVDKTDMNAVNAEIAYMFLYDYIDLIINSDATTTTYTNTLAKLGQDYDLTGYEGYYQMVKKALTNDGVVINSTEGDGIFDVSVTAAGQNTINSLLALNGKDPSDYALQLSMIKEYQEGEVLTATAVATLGNVPSSYEALILDLGAAGVQNKFDYTNDLPTRATTIADKAAVMLLGDVDGDLVFNGTTVLDLNGFTVSGSIVANGTVYIIDSSLDSDECGHVTGTVTGNAKIIAGNYDSDVSAYLAKGYTQNGKAVTNALYTIQVDDYGNITFEINSDVYKDVEGYIPSVKALAVDIAADLVLNYYTTAALTVDGDTLYAVNFEDIFTLLEGSNSQKLENLVDEVLSYIYVDTGITNFINNVIEDLLNFENIAEAINTNKPVASYAVATAPWKVSVNHITDGDYITVGVTNNTDLAKSYNVNLVIVGDTAKTHLAPLAEELANIVTDETHITVALTQPTYDDKTLTKIGGTVDAVLAADLSGNNNYPTAIGVVLAYGNPDKAQAFADAINAGDIDALKEVFDSMSVKEVFDALKKLSRNVAFADMATQVGVTVNTDDAADLEKIYHLVLCGAGKVLEELDITGYADKTMGALYNEETGYYTLSKLNVNRNGDVSYRGYTAEFDATVTELTLKVKIFGEVEEPLVEQYLMGDINLSGDVDITDLNMLYRIIEEESFDVLNDGKPDYIQMIVADVAEVDGDVIDITDLNRLFRYIENLDNEEYDGWVPYYIDINIE